jgi:outer membrane protein OmpA-like peptidoglycan-associated protein
VAFNLSETIGADLTPGVTSQLAAAIGETPEATERATKLAVPAMAAGLAEQASSEAGAAHLLDTIRSGGHDGAITSTFGAALSSPDTRSEVLAEGSGLLPSFFGAHTDDAASVLAHHTGMRRGSMTSLLAFAAPLVMGIVGKRARDENLDARGLSSMLGGQRSLASRLIPSGIGKILGVGGVAAAASRLAGREEPTEARPLDEGAAREETAREEPKGIAPRRPVPPKAPRSWLGPALLTAALALGGYLLLRPKPMHKSVTMNLPSESKGPAATPPAPGTTPGAANAPATPPGQPEGAASPAAPAEGVAALETFLSANPDEAQLPKRFNVGDLDFEQGAGATPDAAKPTLNRLADVLKTHPSAEVRVEGFTESADNPEANQQLSQVRAEKVKAELVARGVEAERIEVEGKGASDPIASNATPTGRKQNRRIEVVLERV